MSLRKIILFFLLVLISKLSFSQEIFISGKKTDRALRWADFTGKVDVTSTFMANTFYNVSYTYDAVRRNGERAKIINLLVKLEFVPEKSWVKPEGQTDELLIHEQGHFNIGILCMYHMLEKLNEAKTKDGNYNQIMKETFQSVMQEYEELGLKYDRETNHSMNKEKQEEWNLFIEAELQKIELKRFEDK